MPDSGQSTATSFWRVANWVFIAAQLVITPLLIPFNPLSTRFVEFMMQFSAVVKKELPEVSSNPSIAAANHFIGIWYTSAMLLNIMSLIVAIIHVIRRGQKKDNIPEQIVLVCLVVLAMFTCFWFFAGIDGLSFYSVVLSTIGFYIFLDLLGWYGTRKQDELLRYLIPLYGLELPALVVVCVELLGISGDHVKSGLLVSAGALTFTSIAYLIVVHWMIPRIENRFTLKNAAA